MGDIVVTTNVEISDPALQLTPGVGGLRVCHSCLASPWHVRDSDATEIDISRSERRRRAFPSGPPVAGEGVTP
jgi:hypothetical protein